MISQSTDLELLSVNVMEITKTNFGERTKISWKITGNTNFEEIYNLIKLLREKPNFVDSSTGMRKKDFLNSDLLANLKKDWVFISYILNTIQENEQPVLEIHTRKKYKRFYIYLICKILGKKFETMRETERKLVGCNEYNSVGQDCCGCDYAPRNFWKYHSHNSYDDCIAYSYLPRTYKIGVRIFDFRGKDENQW